MPAIAPTRFRTCIRRIAREIAVITAVLPGPAALTQAEYDEFNRFLQARGMGR